MATKKTNNVATSTNMTSEDIKMRKPLIVARNEFMQQLIQAANDSGLPFVVMEYVVRDFYDEVRNTASKQYENEKEEYEKLLAQNESK